MINTNNFTVGVVKGGKKLSYDMTSSPYYVTAYKITSPSTQASVFVDKITSEINCMTFKNNLFIFLSQYLNDTDYDKNNSIWTAIQRIDDRIILTALRHDDEENVSLLRVIKHAAEQISKYVYITMRVCGYDINLIDITDYISEQKVTYV